MSAYLLICLLIWQVGSDHDFITILPVHRCGNRIFSSQLQTVNNPENLYTKDTHVACHADLAGWVTLSSQTGIASLWCRARQWQEQLTWWAYNEYTWVLDSCNASAYLFEVAARCGWVQNWQLEFLIRSNDEHCSGRERNACLVYLIRVQHAVPVAIKACCWLCQ